MISIVYYSHISVFAGAVIYIRYLQTSGWIYQCKTAVLKVMICNHISNYEAESGGLITSSICWSGRFSPYLS